MATQSLKILSWNIGFGSRKKELQRSDQLRAENVWQVLDEYKADIVAFQEMANNGHADGTAFVLPEVFEEKLTNSLNVHFEPTTAPGSRQSYPTGKIELLQRQGIIWQTIGPGLAVRSDQGWELANLYADTDADPQIEVQRPMPHPLYMGDEPGDSAGRDQEDRPVLWARIKPLNSPDFTRKVYVVSLHLPTLKGEEKNLAPGDLTAQQQLIYRDMLRLPELEMMHWSVDTLGAELRCYYLHQVLAQAQRLAGYWYGQAECVFILAGDFNFYHTNKRHRRRKPEQQLLEKAG
ncbi:endonuclease/exonuclease/phosphatase family protein, partial [bacterium]|nr:endonuclease/exonuclease/phosphatase family protein [bacterium]